MPPSPVRALFAVFVAGCLAAADAGQYALQDPLQLERELVLRGGISHSLAWSPDGAWIASGGDCGEVLVVDSRTGRVVHELLASDHWIGALHFSPDSAVLFVGGRDLTRWDLATGKQTSRCTTAGPRGVALSRDGKWIACARNSDTAEVRTADGLELERTFAVADETAIDALAFSPDGKRLAVGKRSGTTWVFATATGERLERIAQGGWVQSLAWLDDGRLVRLAWSGTLHGFTAQPEPIGKSAWGMAVDAQARLCLCWNGDLVRGFTPAGKAFDVAGGGPTAIASDGATWVRAHRSQLEFHRGAQRQRSVPLLHRSRPRGAVFPGDGQHLAIANDNEVVSVFRLDDGTAVPVPIGTLRGQPIPYPGGTELVLWESPWLVGDRSGPGRLSFRSIAALRAGEKGLVRECRTPSGSPFRTETPQFSPDGLHFAIGATIHDTLQPERVAWRVPEEFEQSVQAGPRGETALAMKWTDHAFGLGPYELTATLWRADSTRIAQRKFANCSGAGVWSPDGKRLAIVAGDGLHLLPPDGLKDVQTIAGEWSAGTWIDGERMLLWNYQGEIDFVSIAAPGRHTRTALRGGGVVVDRGGTRAAIQLQDRVLVVRIAP